MPFSVTKHQYGLVILILIFAAAARILGSGDYPLWTDEGWSVWAAQSHVIEAVAEDRHPPLYFAALYLWREAAGDSRVALRFLSVVAGMISVAAVYRIGADVYHQRAGIFAALGMAALSAAIYYAQEVRHYGWFTLFTALSWMFLIRCFKRPSRATWTAYALAVAAMFYTLYFAIFTLAAQGIALLIVHTPIRRKFAVFAAWIAAGILYLPWVYIIFTQQASELQTGIAGFPGTLRTPDDLLPMLNILLGTPLIAIIAIIALIVHLWRAHSPSRALRLVPLIGSVGLFIVLLVLSEQFQFIAPRTLIFLAPLAMVTLGAGIATLGDVWGFIAARLVNPRAAPAHAAAAGFVVIALWIMLQDVEPSAIHNRLPADQAVAAVADLYQPGDLIVIEAGWDDNAIAYEFAQALPGANIVRTIPYTNYRIGANVVDELAPEIEAARRIWVVQWLQAPALMTYLDGGGAGYQFIWARDISAGDYGMEFGAPFIAVRLYER